MMWFLIGDKVIITSQRSGNNLEKKLTHINPAKNDELVKGKKVREELLVKWQFINRS